MGFWKHNKKYHNNIHNFNDESSSSENQVLLNENLFLSNINQVLSSENSVLLSSKKYKCKYCDKSYDIVQSRWFHEQKCKIKYNENNENIKIENEKLRTLCAQKYEIELLNNTKIK
jgi:hypothetical protein